MILYNKSKTKAICRSRSVSLSNQQQQQVEQRQRASTRGLISSRSDVFSHKRGTSSNSSIPLSSSNDGVSIVSSSSSTKSSSYNSKHKKKSPTCFLGSPPRSDYPARSFNRATKLPSSPLSSSSSTDGSDAPELYPFRVCSSMKDFEKMLANLRSENFDLKLRIYHMELKMERNLDMCSLYRENCRLKNDIEEISTEVKKLEDLVFLSCGQPAANKKMTVSIGIQTSPMIDDVLTTNKSGNELVSSIPSPVLSDASSYLTAEEGNTSPALLPADYATVRKLQKLSSPIVQPITDETISVIPIDRGENGIELQISAKDEAMPEKESAISTSGSVAVKGSLSEFTGNSKDILNTNKLIDFWLDQSVQNYKKTRKLERLSL